MRRTRAALLAAGVLVAGVVAGLPGNAHAAGRLASLGPVVPSAGSVLHRGTTVRVRPSLPTRDDTYTVNNAGNTNDTSTADGVCQDANGHCTLRAAIQQADASAGSDLIRFAIGTGPATITAPFGLPTLTDHITIDGTTQPGYDAATGHPAISLEGLASGSGVNALTLQSVGDIVVGLEIGDYTGDGIFVNNYNSAVIEGCYIGLDRTGLHARPNAWGIVIDGYDDMITATDAGNVNVVSGNSQGQVSVGYVNGATISGIYVGTTADGSTWMAGGGDGIDLMGTSNTVGSPTQPTVVAHSSIGVLMYGDSNTVQDALIGTDVTGTVALGNGSGVQINGTSNTLTGNLISGNGAGVAAASGFSITGNWIGLDLSGGRALPNNTGISGYAGLIGTTDPTAGGGNVVSGNDVGIVAFGGTTIGANLIGSDVSGTVAIPNGVGVQLGGLNDTLTGNLVSGNSGHGVEIESGSRLSHLDGNVVGVDVNGAPLGNGGSGVYVAAGAGTDEVAVLGGSTANRIADNAGAGVEVASGTGVSIRNNEIDDNGGLGIDLDPTGPAPNDVGDADTGPNDLQNYPVLTSAHGTARATKIVGTLDSAASGTYSVDVYVESACDPSGYGEGDTFLGSADVTTDSSGHASFTMNVSAQSAPPGTVVTALATDDLGDTSEFSACRRVTGQTANLKTLLTADADRINAGNAVTYTATIENGGPGSALNTTATFTIGSGAAYVSVTSSQGTCSVSGRRATCVLGTVPASSAPTATAVVQYFTPRLYQVTAAARTLSYDPDLTNNSALVKTRVY
jgi:uncharacterized repeat protein (TIGR01451 family)